ncbi:hypothetical protein ACCS70_27100 [Rhizobium ruizarguesonis]
MTEIYVGVDTNILLHFGPVKDLKWTDIFPGVTVLNLLVSSTVQKEMDDLKDTAKGYVQKRARDFQRILTAAEETPDYVYRFSEKGVDVNVHFLDSVRRADLDGDRLDLDNDDARIVAEYFHYQNSRDVPVHILANDGRTIRDGKRCEMETHRPNAWAEDRVEAISDRERVLAAENDDLKRRLGARPLLELKRLDILPHHPTIDGDQFDCNAYLVSLGKALKEVGKPRSTTSLIEEFGLDQGFSHGNITMLSSISIELRPDQLEDYEKTVAVFFAAFQIPALEFVDRLRKLSRAYIFDFEIENAGNAPEEMISVDLELDGPGVFTDSEALHELNDWDLSLPEEPRPSFSIRHTIPEFEVPTDIGTWSVAVEKSDFRRYSLRSLLHGHSERRRVYVLPKIQGQKVKVLTTLRAKGLLGPTIRQITLQPVSQPATAELLDEFLLQRSVFLPDDQGELLARVVNRRRNLREAAGG